MSSNISGAYRGQQSTGGGNQTDAFRTGGRDSGYISAAAKWNGSAWASVTNMNFHLGNQAGDGNSSNHVSHGGNGSSNGGNPTPYQNRSESWNGSSWTSRTSTLNQATGVSTYAGNDTSGIMIGGRDTGYDNLRTVEKWNGSSMTDVANLPAYYARSRCAGNDTKALSWNGRISADGSDGGSLTNHQLQYDGTTWTTKSNMPVTVESPNAGGEGL